MGTALHHAPTRAPGEALCVTRATAPTSPPVRPHEGRPEARPAMGAVTDLLNEIPSSRTGTRATGCGVCVLLTRLEPKEAKALIALLSDSSIRYDQIADGLRAKGVADLDRSVYSYHARGECSARTALRAKRGRK